MLADGIRTSRQITAYNIRVCVCVYCSPTRSSHPSPQVEHEDGAVERLIHDQKYGMVQVGGAGAAAGGMGRRE